MYPNEMLSTKCESVISMEEAQPIIDDINKEMDEMNKDELRALGIAANQLEGKGYNKRVGVMLLKNGEKLSLVNPIITEMSDLRFVQEGCLSFPGVFKKVERYMSVTVECLNGIFSFEAIEDDPKTLWEVQEVQHEIDHMNGLTILDRMAKPIKKDVKYGRNDPCPICGKKIKKCQHKDQFLNC